MPRTVLIKNAQRCPLCREQVTPTQARRLIACSACETVYHRSCFGEMGGCAVLGCQRSCDPKRRALTTTSDRGAKPLATKAPTKQATPKQVRETDKPGPPAPLRVRRIALVAWILLLWLVGIVNIGLSLVPTLISVAYLAWRRSGTALVVFGLAPAVVIFGFNFTWGVVDYGRGTAVCRGFGLAGQEYSNLSPRLRCYRRSKGCTGNGQEFFTQEAYNIAVMKLIRLFGPMTGSYTGPYPTRASAYRALSEATCVIPVDEVKLIGEYKGWPVPGRPRLVIDGATVLPGQIPNLFLWQQFSAPVRLRVLEGQCLLIGDPDSEIWLVDLESGKRFATYCDLGEQIEELR